MASSLSRDKLWLFKPDSSGGFQAPESLGFEPEKADYYPRALFDHTGNHLALVRREMIEIRSYPNGEFTKIPIPFHNRAGQWSPDGRFLITTDGGGFCLIDTQNRELIESVEWQIGASRPSWSPDSKFIAIPHALENKIRIWSPGSKSFVRDVTGHSGRISCASWHPDGSRLATAEGSNILLWDTGTWNVLGVLRKHQQTIRDLEWSPDGKSLLSLGTDQLLVWDLD